MFSREYITNRVARPFNDLTKLYFGDANWLSKDINDYIIIKLCRVWVKNPEITGPKILIILNNYNSYFISRTRFLFDEN